MRAVTPVARVRGAQAQAGEGDGARSQLAKYFPIETAGTYLGLSAVVLQGTTAGSTSRIVWLWVIFAVLLVVTGADLLRLYPTTRYRHRWVPVSISLGAYLIWAYEVRGLADELSIYNGVAAAVLAGLYGLVAARVVPEPATNTGSTPAVGPIPPDEHDKPGDARAQGGR